MGSTFLYYTVTLGLWRFCVHFPSDKSRGVWGCGSLTCGIRLTWMLQKFSLFTLNWNCLKASMKGMLSMSPTVPPNCKYTQTLSETVLAASAEAGKRTWSCTIYHERRHRLFRFFLKSSSPPWKTPPSLWHHVTFAYYSHSTDFCHDKIQLERKEGHLETPGNQDHNHKADVFREWKRLKRREIKTFQTKVEKRSGSNEQFEESCVFSAHKLLQLCIWICLVCFL